MLSRHQKLQVSSQTLNFSVNSKIIPLDEAIMQDLIDTKNFPPIVLPILYCVCIVFEKTPSVDACHNLFKQKNFLADLKSIVELTTNQHMLIDKYIHKEDFDSWKIYRVSLPSFLIAQRIKEIHMATCRHLASQSDKIDLSVFKKCPTLNRFLRRESTPTGTKKEQSEKTYESHFSN